MKKKLNEKQQMILNFLNQEVIDKGYPPSVREICKAVHLKSTSTVHSYLKAMEKEGLIQKDPTKPRALKVVGKETHSPSYTQPATPPEIYHRRELVDVPIIGKVAAGQPILADQNIEETFPLPVDFLQNNDAFMLRVQGESMIEAGIFDKDLVLVSQQNTAKNGDIVVALIGDEATVKTFYKEKDHIRLQPENRQLEPIIVKNDISILGRVIGVYRKL